MTNLGSRGRTITQYNQMLHVTELNLFLLDSEAFKFSQASHTQKYIIKNVTGSKNYAQNKTK